MGDSGAAVRGELVTSREVERASPVTNVVIHRVQPNLTPRSRQEIKLLVKEARANKACQTIHTRRIKGRDVEEELATFLVPVEESQIDEVTDRIGDQIEDDALDRPSGERHSYTIEGVDAEGKTRCSTKIRISGGTRDGTEVREYEPTSQGQVKGLMRHNEIMYGLFEKNHQATVALLASELKDTRQALKEANAELRLYASQELELSRKRRLQEAEVETERAAMDEIKARTDALRDLTAKLNFALPLVIKQAGAHFVAKKKAEAAAAAKAKGANGAPDAAATPAGSAEAAPSEPTRASPEVARVLGTISEEQLARLKGEGFTDAELEAFRTARDKNILDPLIALSGEFGSGTKLQALFNVATPEQFEALIQAVPNDEAP